MKKKTQQIVAFAFGVTFVVVILLIAVFFPAPSQFQYTVFRIVLALATAGVTAMIPGFLSIELGILGAIIRAGGAIGVFVIVYFFSPAQLISEPPPTAYKASVTLRKFDLTDKFTTSPVVVSTESFPGSDWHAERDRLVFDVMEKIRRTSYPEVTFTIDSDQLRTTEHVVLWMPGLGVQGLGSLRPITELTPEGPLDLPKLFAHGYPGGYSLSSDHAELRFRCADRFFETNQLSVQKTPTGYALLVDGQSTNKVSIAPRPKVALLDSFAGQGTPQAEGFAADLQMSFETAVANENQLTLSSYTLPQLEAVRTELLRWPFEKSGKGKSMEQYAADVIISGVVSAIPR